MQIVTLCGSLRARSLNRAVLRAYARLAPPELAFVHCEQIGALPHFNPDLDGETPPPEVSVFRGFLAKADALVLSTPEYAHGLPGSFNNALDWLVSDPGFVGKPVVILHAERGSTWALDSLREVLKTMSAKILEPASVLLPFGTIQLDEEAILAREDLRRLLLGSLEHLRHHLTGSADEHQQLR
ncbi:MAG: NADPH-dependent reductase [Pedosphaera sp.]|nr:NADPH-dependent reductase [Pedosphaera sp.]